MVKCLYCEGIIYHMSQDFRGESVNFEGEILLPNSSEINTEVKSPLLNLHFLNLVGHSNFIVSYG